jgi:hypothetical protein
MSLSAPARGAAKVSGAQDTRQTLVDALGAVQGLTATPSAPDVATAGATWPVWALTDYAGRLGAPSRRTYDVFVVLPAGYLPDTVDQADGLVDQVAGALWPVAVIQTAEPVQIQFDDSAVMPGLRVRVIART